MVFFTCNSCGESLRKNKVANHLSHCRSTSISCVDCNKDFTYDYQSHNQCVSEDQKYGGIDYKPKENSFKGRAKQEEWIEKVKKVITESNSNNHIKNLMQKLVTYDNIPRKKPKFINFVRNCLHITNDYYGQQMWDIFETSIKSDLNSDNCSNNQSKSVANDSTRSDDKRPNESDISEQKKSKKLKRNANKSESNCSEEINSSEKETNGSKASVTQMQSEDMSTKNGTKDLAEVMNCETKEKIRINKMVLEILKNRANNEISLKKLKKKVLKKYKSIDDSFSDEYIVSKFDRRLNKNKKIFVENGRVGLK